MEMVPMEQELIDAIQELTNDISEVTRDYIFFRSEDYSVTGASDLCQGIADNAMKAKEIFKIYESIIKEK
ncbi:hypothetical protein FC88_GL000448 [Companilactobacillus futsaii JCM 17355]|nr:hypothetical protein FC88_GL000448 [Companilactobacillus futsaii JCM 17355]